MSRAAGVGRGALAAALAGDALDYYSSAGVALLDAAVSNLRE